MICSLPWPAGPVARPSPFPDRAKIPHGYITGQELAVFIHCPDRLLGFPPFNDLQSSSSDWKLVATDHVPNVARLAALAYTCHGGFRFREFLILFRCVSCFSRYRHIDNTSCLAISAGGNLCRQRFIDMNHPCEHDAKGSSSKHSLTQLRPLRLRA